MRAFLIGVKMSDDISKTGIASGAMSLGGSIMQAAHGYYSQKNLARQQQANYLKNLAQSYEYGQEGQRNAASNAVQGYRKAGMSPALASAGNFSAPAVSAPLGSASSPHVDNGIASAFVQGVEADTRKKQVAINDSLAVSEIAQRKEQVDLTKAQKDLVEQQAKELEIENSRKDAEDATVHESLVSWASAELDKATENDDVVAQAVWSNILTTSKDERFNRGTMEAMRDVNNVLTSMDSNNLKRWNNIYNLEITRGLISSHSWNFVIDMPRLEREKAIASIGQIGMQTAALFAESRLNMHKIQEINANVAKIEAETEMLFSLKNKYEAEADKAETERLRIYHNDPAAMLAARDLQAFGVYAFGRTLQTAENVVPQLVGIGSKTKMAGKALEQAAEQFETEQKNIDAREERKREDAKQFGVSSEETTYYDSDGNVKGTTTKRFNRPGRRVDNGKSKGKAKKK